MTDLKIGKLLFRKEAIILIACCLFINGVIIGAFAMFKSMVQSDVSFIFVYIAMFIPYIFLFKKIKRNITELE